MKTIFKIAKFELSTMFYSPIAWLVLVLFMIQCGMNYADAISGLHYAVKMNFRINNGITFDVFSHQSFGMFNEVLRNAYLFIPLLTMGLISKELYSGSIKLVLSSPVTAVQLVLGKYLTMLIYIGFMSLCLAAVVFFAGLSIANVDYSLILFGIMAFYVLSATYAAIGLLISSLTSYQVVAAVGTLALLGFLNYIGEIGQGVPYIEDLTYWLSLSGRTQEMVFGLLTTNDIIYFIVIIALFLSLSVLKIAFSRNMMSKPKKTMVYAMVFGIAFLLAYVGSIPDLISFYDTTDSKLNTLTKESIDVIDQIDGQVTMTSYVNIFDGNVFDATPENRKNDEEKFRKYRRYLPDLKMEYVYFYDEIPNSFVLTENQGVPLPELAESQADLNDVDFNLVLSPEEIKERIDLSGEENRFTRQLSYNGKTSFVRMFNDTQRYPEEEEMSSALKRLVTTPPKVVFLTGHGERQHDKASDEGFKKIMMELNNRSTMVNKGFDFVKVDLSKMNIPNTTSILVIADPKSPYGIEELAKIESYVKRGGNLLLMAEPQHRQVVRSIADMIEIRYIPGELHQNIEDQEPNFILASFLNTAADKHQTFADMVTNRNSVATISAMGVESMSDDFKVYPLLGVSSNDTEVKIDSLPAKPIDTPIALLLERETKQNKQRMVVLGDADFSDNQGIGYGDRKSANYEMMKVLFGYLTDGAFPVQVQRPKKKDLRFMIGKEQLKTHKYILVGLIPFVFVCFGSFVLIRRKLK